MLRIPLTDVGLWKTSKCHSYCR